MSDTYDIPLKELNRQIIEAYIDFRVEAENTLQGNTGASSRSRDTSIELSKLLTAWRNNSFQRQCEENVVTLDPWKIYEFSLRKYGPIVQSDQTVEEMSELIVALQHQKRGRPSNVVEELADVIITTRTLKMLYGPQIVDEEVARKTIRLAHTLLPEEQHREFFAA